MAEYVPPDETALVLDVQVTPVEVIVEIEGEMPQASRGQLDPNEIARRLPNSRAKLFVNSESLGVTLG
jgi:hypothetical protein